MKMIIQLLVILGTVLSIEAIAQDDLIKNVKSGFKSGNIKEISPYLNQKVEIALDGDKVVYDKAKAEKVLEEFIHTVKPTDFQVLHQGASKEGFKFFIGELTTAGSTHRVLVYSKNTSGKTLIETIDISKE